LKENTNMKHTLLILCKIEKAWSTTKGENGRDEDLCDYLYQSQFKRLITVFLSFYLGSSLSWNVLWFLCLPPVRGIVKSVTMRCFIMFQVNEWEVGNRGLLYDRQRMIVTDLGVCLTQKREPRLCLIKPSVDLLSKILSVTAPGYGVFTYIFCY